jgi:hypothetical protein
MNRFLQEVIGLMSPIHLLPYFKRTYIGDIYYEYRILGTF